MTSPDPTTPQTPPDPPGPRRLTRSSTDQVLGGVGGGLGRYFGVDPILFRIGFAVVALAGGAGLLAYLALWLLVPDEEGEGAKRPNRRQLTKIALIGGGGLLLFLVFGLFPDPDFFIWPGFFGLLALGLLVAAVVGADRGGDASSRLLRAGVVVLAVVAAGVAGFAAAIGTAFGGGAVVAGIVIVCGLGLVAGAFGSGRRWLLVPALVLAAPAAVVQAADLRVRGGIGEREYRPASVADVRDRYELGIGELTVDLTGVEFPAGRTSVGIDHGVGEVQVIVPDDVCVSSVVTITAGVADVFDRVHGGTGVDWTQAPRSGAATAELHVEADLTFGAIEIRHAGDEPDVGEHDRGPFGRWDDDDDRIAPVRQEACG